MMVHGAEEIRDMMHMKDMVEMAVTSEMVAELAAVTSQSTSNQTIEWESQ